MGLDTVVVTNGETVSSGIVLLVNAIATIISVVSAFIAKFNQKGK